MPTQQPGTARLARTLDRWDVTALVVNGILGSAIFGLPAVLIGLLGATSPIAYLIAGAGMAVIVLCFAEVSSLFREAGGPYLYAREAFGPWVGLQVGWIAWLVRIASAGANADLFALYAGELWRPARSPAGRVLIVTLLIGLLAAINCRGVRHGARVSNFFALAKLLPLGVFILAGLFSLHGDYFRFAQASSWGQWFRAVLLLVFAYGGFEIAVYPSSEARDPGRDTPFALLAGLGLVTLVYLLVHIVVLGTLPPGTQADRPLALAARQFMGAGGAWLLSAGALISVYGWFSGNLLSVPRLTFALGERGDLPGFFAVVHPRSRAPHISILVFAGLSWALAIGGTFRWNATLSALARLLTYGTTCAAMLVFRRRGRSQGGFRVPAGWLVALAALGFCVILLLQMGRVELGVLAVTMALATATRLWTRRRAPAGVSGREESCD